MQTVALAVAAVAMLDGCAINQTIHPADVASGVEVCIVENPAVRENFAAALRAALGEQGLRARMLPATANPQDCPVTMTYVANWRWDLAMYMAYARLQVFRDGRPAGDAVYDSLRGGANMNKFISADVKTRELVGQLFPKH
jgi:hypothetical protein